MLTAGPPAEIVSPKTISSPAGSHSFHSVGMTLCDPAGYEVCGSYPVSAGALKLCSLGLSKNSQFSIRIGLVPIKDRRQESIL